MCVLKRYLLARDNLYAMGIYVEAESETRGGVGYVEGFRKQFCYWLDFVVVEWLAAEICGGWGVLSGVI